MKTRTNIKAGFGNVVQKHLGQPEQTPVKA